MRKNSKPNIDVDYETAHDRARLARDVYKNDKHEDNGIGDWVEVIRSDAFDLPKHSTGFVGGFYMRVDDETGEAEYAIVYSGMDGIEDLEDAITLAVIGYPKQFYDAYIFAQEIAEAYDIDLKTTDFVGHSMGGYLAQSVGIACGAEKMWMYNSPSMRIKDIKSIGKQLLEKLSDDMHVCLKDMNFENLGERIESFRTRNDVVARLGNSQRTVLESGVEMRPHSIETLEKLLLNAANAEDGHRASFNEKSINNGLVSRFTDEIGDRARDMITSFVSSRKPGKWF